MKEIVQERVLAAAPEIVFAAWRDPTSLAVWMCPDAAMSHASVEVDFRVGGRFRIVMHGTRDYEHSGEYLEIEPARRLVFTWVSHFMPAAEQRTRVRVTFEPVGTDRTHLRLVHTELPDTDSYDGHRAGWATILAKLDAHLAAH
jgi:uncharacterized protein YndB with AHSA1/START domain